MRAFDCCFYGVFAGSPVLGREGFIRFLLGPSASGSSR